MTVKAYKMKALYYYKKIFKKIINLWQIIKKNVISVNKSLRVWMTFI